MKITHGIIFEGALLVAAVAALASSPVGLAIGLGVAAFAHQSMRHGKR